MSRYARETGVSVEKSQVEIKRTLRRYGADNIVFGDSAGQRRAFVQFTYENLPVRAIIPLPSPAEARFTKSPMGKRQRDPRATLVEWEKACRQQWRVLLLLIKAQLEGIQNEIFTPREVFLSWLVLPSGQTVSQWALPQLEAAEKHGGLPALPLPGGD